MQTTKKKGFLSTRRLAVMGMMTALVILLTYTPIGFVPIGPVSATIMHLPVLVCLMMEGFGAGVTMGGVFGAVSLLRALTMPTSPMDVFFLNPLVSILPRLLVPVVAWAVLKLFDPLVRKNPKWQVAAWGASAFAGTFTNTACVLAMIYWLYAAQYAQMAGIAQEAVGGALVGIAAINGSIEAALAMVVLPLIMGAVSRVTARLR